MTKPPGLVLSDFAPYRLVVLARRISEDLGDAYADEGLTIPEWRVLAVVSQQPSMAARDVVAATPMDKMAVSRAVASLVAKGLAVRGASTDRRVLRLTVTAKGRALFERVAAIARGYEAELLSCLTTEERNAVFDAIDKLERKTRVMASARSEREAAE